MAEHAAGWSGDGFDFEVGDGVIHNIKCGLIIGECDLLKEQCQFSFDLFGFVEEVELVLLLLGDEFGHDLLELLRASFQWKFIGPKGLILVVDEIDQHVLR